MWTHQKEREPRLHKSVSHPPPVHPLICSPGHSWAKGRWLQDVSVPQLPRVEALRGHPRWSPGQPPPIPPTDGSLWPRDGQRGLGLAVFWTEGPLPGCS